MCDFPVDCGNRMQVWAAAILIGMPERSTAASRIPDTSLWYEAPARHWLEAMPVGNGRMGAVVHGGTAVERVQFNEQSLCNGTGLRRGFPRHTPL